MTENLYGGLDELSVVNVSAERFSNSVNSMERFSKMFTHYQIEELNSKDFHLFLLPDKNAGFAIRETSEKVEIVNIHNNTEKDFKNLIKGNTGKTIGQILLEQAILICQKKFPGKLIELNHFDGFLSDFYLENGFEEIKRGSFDLQYDLDKSFFDFYGFYPDIVYRRYKDPVYQTVNETRDYIYSLVLSF